MKKRWCLLFMIMLWRLPGKKTSRFLLAASFLFILEFVGIQNRFFYLWRLPNTHAQEPLDESIRKTSLKAHFGAASTGTKILDPSQYKLLETVYFPKESYELPEKEKEKISRLSHEGMVRVYGYTDSLGSLKFNNVLAKLRAQAVFRLLREKGIEVEKLESQGKCCYVVSENPSLNRRVEIRRSETKKKPTEPEKSLENSLGNVSKKPTSASSRKSMVRKEKSELREPSGKLKTVPKKKVLQRKKTKFKDDEESSFKKEKGMEFMWLSEISSYVTYSKLMKGTSITGGNFSAVLAPAVKFDKKKDFISLYNVNYSREKQVYQEDEGPKQRSENLVHGFTPTLRYHYSPLLTFSPAVFYTQGLTRETEEEEWQKGLYDYIDKGYGTDVKWTFYRSSGASHELLLGAKRYSREYPNFRSLYAVAGLGDLEEKEKDFKALFGSAGYALRKEQGLAGSMTLNYLKKDFLDKKIETAEGGRSWEWQRDHNITFNMNVGYRSKRPMSYSMNGTLSYNKSNQNLVEGSFPDLLFHKNYYSSFTWSVSPTIFYNFRRASGKVMRFRFSYSFTKQRFLERKARTAEGLLQTRSEISRTHKIFAGFDYYVLPTLSIGLNGNYTKAGSNTKEESVYRYNYAILNVSLGFVCKY